MAHCLGWNSIAHKSKFLRVVDHPSMMHLATVTSPIALSMGCYFLLLTMSDTSQT